MGSKHESVAESENWRNQVDEKKVAGSCSFTEMEMSTEDFEKTYFRGPASSEAIAQNPEGVSKLCELLKSAPPLSGTSTEQISLQQLSFSGGFMGGVYFEQVSVEAVAAEHAIVIKTELVSM